MIKAPCQESVFFRRIGNLPCIIRTLRSGLKELKILVDSGATNNYIRDDLRIGNRIKLDKPLAATTPHGRSK